jgi:hypothetical protein
VLYVRALCAVCVCVCACVCVCVCVRQAKPWKFLQKRQAKEAKMESPPASSRHERDFVPMMLANFLKALALAGGEAEEEEEEDEDDDDDDEEEEEEAAAEEGAKGDGAETNGHGGAAKGGEAKGGAAPAPAPPVLKPEAARAGLVRYLERSLELIIDLLAQLPTRRFFHAVLLDQHVLEKARLSA